MPQKHYGRQMHFLLYAVESAPRKISVKESVLSVRKGIRLQLDILKNLLLTGRETTVQETFLKSEKRPAKKLP